MIIKKGKAEALQNKENQANQPSAILPFSKNDATLQPTNQSDNKHDEAKSIKPPAKQVQFASMKPSQESKLLRQILRLLQFFSNRKANKQRVISKSYRL